MSTVWKSISEWNAKIYTYFNKLKGIYLLVCYKIWFSVENIWLAMLFFFRIHYSVIHMHASFFYVLEELLTHGSFAFTCYRLSEVSILVEYCTS